MDTETREHTLDQVRQIIRTAYQDGLGGSFAQTFIFLWTGGRNVIDSSQEEISAEMGINSRTLRSHLYELQEQGWIDYSIKTSNGNKSIQLKRFQH